VVLIGEMGVNFCAQEKSHPETGGIFIEKAFFKDPLDDATRKGEGFKEKKSRMSVNEAGGRGPLQTRRKRVSGGVWKTRTGESSGPRLERIKKKKKKKKKTLFLRFPMCRGKGEACMR